MCAKVIYVYAEKIFTPKRQIDKSVIEISDDVIKSIRKTKCFEEFKKEKIKKFKTECKFLKSEIIAPGYFDIHIQGCNGHDFIDTDEAGTKKILEGALKGGCTHILPTITISKHDVKLERFTKVIEAISENKKYINGAEITGIHLEGPYLNPNKKGGFPLDFIKPPNIKEFKQILKIIIDICGEVFFKLITIAPEIDGADEIIKECLRSGIKVSLGHTIVSYDAAKEYFKKGVDHITHIFNAMDGLNHRAPGLLGAALDTDSVYCQIIPDGIHLHPAILRLLYKLKGSEKLAIISDATAPCGLSEGSVIKAFNGNSIITVKDGAVRNQDGTLAGSALLMDKAVSSFVKFTNVNLSEAFTMSSLTPLNSVLHKPINSLIEPSKPANILLLKKNLKISHIIKGNIIHEL